MGPVPDPEDMARDLPPWASPATLADAAEAMAAAMGREDDAPVSRRREPREGK